MSQVHHDEICLGLEDGCDAKKSGVRCAACHAYAATLEPLESRSAAPLPSFLETRLCAMTEDFEDVDPLYVSALAGEPLNGLIPPGEANNPGRRAAHDALAVTFGEARRRRPLPPTLAASLRKTPRRHAVARLPMWLADPRWATAACLLLTAALGSIAGDASARFQQTTALVYQAPAASEVRTGVKTEVKRIIDFPVELGGLGRRLEEVVQLARGGLDGVRATAAETSRWSQRQAEILGTKAREEYDLAAERLGEAAEQWSNSEPGRWLADFVDEGENHD